MQFTPWDNPMGTDGFEFKFVPQLRDTIMLQECGHWTQQERPAEVNAAMVAFLKSLG